MFYELMMCFDNANSGGEEIRTPVQTYPSKAFYMLICLLLVGRWQENNKPNISLAECA
jgi:hypothetical protein